MIDVQLALELQKNLHLMDEGEQAEVLLMLEKLEEQEKYARCRKDFLAFCRHIEKDYLVGKHHKKLAALLMDLEQGTKDRIAVSIAPRHGKSYMMSYLYPAWYLGNHPDHEVLMVSHTADLAVDFGRKVRNLINSEAYKQIFPDVSLAQDSKSAGRWNTNKGGTYFAVGVGGAVAGRGAHLLLIDDPHNEQDIINGNFEVFEKAYAWFSTGARTRLRKGGRIAVVHTRWHQEDLIGRLVKNGADNEGADQYEVFEFPAILEVEDKEGNVVQKALWPEMFDLTALMRTKASMPTFQWNAQYMQSPTGQDGAIIKREWWREWTRENPPECEFILMTLDAAAEKKERSDFTALATWGVFRSETLTNNEAHIILLNVINVRVEFPELKDLALREYKEWKPDSFIVEKKSAGTALYQELRRVGVFVQEFNPSKATGDKIARINAVADIFRSGYVWYPVGRRWAEELIEQVTAFPFGSHDDMVDVTSMALTRFRNGGFIRLASDEQDEDEAFMPRRTMRYY